MDRGGAQLPPVPSRDHSVVKRADASSKLEGWGWTGELIWKWRKINWQTQYVVGYEENFKANEYGTGRRVFREHHIYGMLLGNLNFVDIGNS